MTSEYEAFVRSTMFTSEKRDPRVALAVYGLGLAGEAGEVIEPIKKNIDRDKPIDPEQFALELGDVLWYLTALAISGGFTLEDIMKRNVDKLSKRAAEGTHGFLKGQLQR
jgi:NTP pyrophosphatase (non-canonical NTP hydrolase)